MGEQSGWPTHIAMMGSVLFVRADEKLTAFWNSNQRFALAATANLHRKRFSIISKPVQAKLAVFGNQPLRFAAWGAFCFAH
jgi:hypothetical protein